MNKDKKQGGARKGAGRKKSKREIAQAAFWLYADQLPATSAEVRAALDEYRQKKSDLVQ